MDASTTARLKAITDRTSAVTDGPWEASERCVFVENEDIAIVSDEVVGSGENAHGVAIERTADVDFIAESRTDIPFLLGVIEALVAENTALRATGSVPQRIKGP